MDERYFVELAAAFVRGRLGAAGDESNDDAVHRGLAAGLKLHKFKRNTELPRVRRVLGMLRGLGPERLLDVGSGRGTFLWPLLDALADVQVCAVDRDARRAGDLSAVARGGVERLRAAQADAAHLPFAGDSFDVVTLLEVLEHLPRPEEAGRQALRVTRRFVVASVPTHEDDNPEHIHLFDEKSLAALFPGARISFEHVLNHTICVARK